MTLRRFPEQQPEELYILPVLLAHGLLQSPKKLRARKRIKVGSRLSLPVSYALFFSYHSIVRLRPSSKVIFATNPKRSRARVVSNIRRG